MTGFSILEVTIGLAFSYLLLSLVSSVLQEMIASALKLRAKNLWQGVQSLLHDESLAKQLYGHGLLEGMCKGDRKPSYLPSRTFALALMDVIKPPKHSGSLFEAAKTSLDDFNIPSDRLREVLKALVEDAGDDAERFRENIEEWFDDSMDRIGGWYKRQARLILLGIGVVVAVGLNVDSIHVAETLWEEPKLRAAISEEAGKFIQTKPDGTPDTELKDLLSAVDALPLPIGWRGGLEAKFYPAGSSAGDQIWSWITAVVGWSLTALAISLGASFWFDALGKLLKLRTAGTAPARKTKPAT